MSSGTKTVDGSAGRSGAGDRDVREGGGTTLDASIAGIPWEADYLMGRGDGIDAVTGKTKNTAVEPYTVDKPTSRSSNSSFRLVTDDSTLEKQVDTSARGKYNIQGVTVTGSTEYLATVKYSAKSTTLVAEYEMQLDDYDAAPAGGYRLTEDAEQRIHDRDRFREQYGDYFVAGGRRGARFVATYVCEAESEEDMTAFKNAIGASMDKVFESSGAITFSKAAADHHVTTTCAVFAEGYTPGWAPPSGALDPSQIVAALDGFKNNTSDEHYIEALLRHYSYIDPDYPLTVDVPPDVFDELRQLYALYWDVSSRYLSAPAPLLKDRYHRLESGITSHQGELATDETERRQYLTDAKVLDFFLDVREAAATEPGKDRHQNAGNGLGTWNYGYQSAPADLGLTVHTWDDSYHQGSGIGHRSHTFTFDSRGAYVVIGWEVVAHWTDGSDGFWAKEVDTVLLDTVAAVYVEGKYDRGTNWSVHVAYVDASTVRGA
ncbi:hypothetical protein ACIPYS_26175 [Kitasatospora sp. NPDC089913]|uniref:hypothetical protein n=1 Tax=Kitasatospora sp. NPDC089913 TaxID=3364080 RepID=UPI00381C64CB